MVFFNDGSVKIVVWKNDEFICALSAQPRMKVLQDERIMNDG